MHENLGQRAVKGVAWLGSGQMIRMIISFSVSIVMARLLPPADFGLFGMTYIAAELAQLFTAFGFGSALIQQQTNNNAVLTSCFWVNVAIGSLIALGLIAISPLLSLYFQRAEITFLVIPLAINLIVGAAMVVPQALLSQRLQFKQLTTAQTCGSAMAAVATISAASLGAGVWSLALQPLAGNLMTCALMMVLSRWRPAGHFKFAEVRPLMKFSTHLLFGSLVDWVSRNLPIIIIGRVLGATALGFYGMATGLTGAIIFQISSVIVRVLFPTLAILKGDAKRMGEGWLKACSAIAVLAWPLLAGAIAMASDLIPVVFGDKWMPSVVPFQMLSALMAIQAVATTAGSVLMAYGRTGTMLRISILSALAYAAALFAGSQSGLNGVAISYAAVGILSQLGTLYAAARVAELPVLAMVRELRPWALVSVVLGISIVVLHAALSGMQPLHRLVACVVAGIALYPALLALLARQRTLDLIEDVRSRMRR